MSMTDTKLIPVKNTQGGPTVFRDSANDVTFKWQGVGDPSGNDVQFIPETYQNHPQFAAILRKGVLVLAEGDSEMTEPSSSGSSAQISDLEKRAQDAIHRPENNDFLMEKCVGPGSRSGAVCEVLVPLKHGDSGNVAPLCDAHKQFAGQFVPVAGISTDGKPSTAWVQMQVES